MSDTNLEQQVNELANQLIVGEDGKVSLPDGVEADDTLIFAAKLEKRRRDTQTTYTKSQQRLRELEAENSKLASSWEQDLVSSLSLREQTRLEELKATDPEAWRDELNSLEQKAKDTFTTKRQEVAKEAKQQTELERRQELLDEYNAANPDAQLTDDVIDNDIPPRLVRQLEKGEVTFEQFLEKAGKYITTPKAIKQPPTPPEEPEFYKSRGSSKLSKQTLEGQSSKNYQNEIY